MDYNVDLQKIADELDFDLEDIEMIFGVFLEGSKKSLCELKKAIELKNMEDIFHLAHSIKGSAANLTLMEISNIAKEIEFAADSKENIDYKSKFEALRNMVVALS